MSTCSMCESFQKRVFIYKSLFLGFCCIGDGVESNMMISFRSFKDDGSSRQNIHPFDTLDYSSNRTKFRRRNEKNENEKTAEDFICTIKEELLQTLNSKLQTPSSKLNVFIQSMPRKGKIISFPQNKMYA